MPARSLHDTRLLTNLIKTEKDAQTSFKAWTKDANSASAALSAWSVADSGDTQDIMDVSVRISQLLASFAESQREYIHALTAYRSSLKDILDRETSLKTVMRDREILVGRLIKLGNKKPNDSALDKHQQQLDEAHRELAGCETFLQEEEALLNEAKRKSFRDALAMRMQSMGDLGRIMEESSHEAVELLQSLEVGEYTPHDYSQDRENIEFNDGDSMTPSQSASQALSRSSSYDSLRDADFHSAGGGTQTATSNGTTRSPRATSPARVSSATRNAAPPTRQLSGIVARAPAARAPAAGPTLTSVPRMAPVPTAPRPMSSYVNATETGIPGFEIPKAPVLSRPPDGDSSDEEDTRAFNAVQGLPSTQRSSYYPYDAPASPAGPAAGRLRRRANSDTSSVAPGGRKRRGSFFGSIASLFKKKERQGDGDSDVGRGLRHTSSSNWQTRTDKNVFAAQRTGGIGRVVGRSAREADSSEDDMPKNVVRVVNDPKMRAKAMSDIGRPMSVSAPKVVKAKRPKRAASDIGVSTSMSPLPPPIPTIRKEATPTITPSVRTATNKTIQDETASVKRKKKKVKEEPHTLVLSAEKLGIPTSATPNGQLTPNSAAPPARQKLSRSNTVNSAATATSATTAGGTIKKKKKKTIDAPVAPPSAADLAATLPSARGTYNPITNPLPLPSDSPSAPAVHNAPSPAAGATESEGVAGKVPKSLAATEKRSKKEAARYSNGDWVQHPTQPHHPHTKVTKGKTDVAEGEDSLMALVDRAEGGEDRTPSRSYGSKATSGTSTPVDAGLAIPRAPGTHSGASGLSKRKSVRMADGAETLAPPPGGTVSPTSSIRSSNTSPRHGILVNNQPQSSATELSTNGASGWSTRMSTGTGAAADDSSDEDEDYRKARKAFSKHTKGIDAAFESGGAGRYSSAQKGKGRAE